jgi:hypothetical protein
MYRTRDLKNDQKSPFSTPCWHGAMHQYIAARLYFECDSISFHTDLMRVNLMSLHTCSVSREPLDSKANNGFAKSDRRNDARARMSSARGRSALHLFRLACACAALAFMVCVSPAAFAQARNDFNGDGKSDLMWRSSGLLAFWMMDGSNVSRYFTTSNPVGWEVAASGDYNGDGRSDLLWLGPNRALAMWFSSGSGFSGESLGTAPAGWTIVNASADVTGDGRADILWFSSGGAVAYWAMNGASIVGGRAVTPTLPTPFIFSGARDANGDGRADLMVSKNNQMWLWTATAQADGSTDFSEVMVAGVPSGWLPRGFADVTGDGRGDLLWHHQTTQSFAFWAMNGASITNGALVTPTIPSIYQVHGIGDYDGNGREDILWTLPSSYSQRDMRLWLSTGSDMNQVNMGLQPQGWLLIPLR